MILTAEEWATVKGWLINLRVNYSTEVKKPTHQKIKDFYSAKSIEIRSFLKLKGNSTDDAVYQMQAMGSYAMFNGEAKILSRVVYKNKEDITKEVEGEFIKLCTTPLNEDDMFYMANVNRVRINELFIK
jgi:hypothetical protein